MSSFLLTKLETLMAQEEKNKLEQKVLLEEIELEIEKKRRLEMDGTIIKLRTQVDEFAKNIEGKIMYNNIEAAHPKHRGVGRLTYQDEQLITLKEFTDNLKNVSVEKKALYSWCKGGINKELVTIPPEIKIYNDIIPLFTTMIGIMNKQQRKIDKLERSLIVKQREKDLKTKMEGQQQKKRNL